MGEFRDERMSSLEIDDELEICSVARTGKICRVCRHGEYFQTNRAQQTMISVEQIGPVGDDTAGARGNRETKSPRSSKLMAQQLGPDERSRRRRAKGGAEKRSTKKRSASHAIVGLRGGKCLFQLRQQQTLSRFSPCAGVCGSPARPTATSSCADTAGRNPTTARCLSRTGYNLSRRLPAISCPGVRENRKRAPP